MSKNPENWWKSIKIANIDREILDNFWTAWGISITYSEKMWLMIILTVTKNQGFIPSLQDKFFEKPQGGLLNPLLDAKFCNDPQHLFLSQLHQAK